MSKKILIIEDDVFLGDVLLQKLTKQGYDAVLKRDGSEGFESIKTWKPDLVLLDIILPSMNGYEILEAKFKDIDIVNIPVIVISNSGQPVEINRALALGIKDYLVKAQFDPEEVMAKVHAQLQKSEGLESLTIPPKTASTVSLEGKKIMWVEDDQFLNDIIARKLSTLKCIFFHSADGKEAIEIIKKEIPDVILLDIILSDMDGYEILKQVKADQNTKHIPVILLSNLGADSDIKKGKDLGAETFLVKATVTIDEILEEIKNVIEAPKK